MSDFLAANGPSRSAAGSTKLRSTPRRSTPLDQPHFNESPAEHSLEHGHVRLTTVGDWGSGVKHAGALAKLMAQEVQARLGMGRTVHVVHLGDVYFAGDPEEYRDPVLADPWWPVTTEQADTGVGSWALAGNHDLHGGARVFHGDVGRSPRPSSAAQRTADQLVSLDLSVLGHHRDRHVRERRSVRTGPNGTASGSSGRCWRYRPSNLASD